MLVRDCFELIDKKLFKKLHTLGYTRHTDDSLELSRLRKILNLRKLHNKIISAVNACHGSQEPTT